ncbi:MAG: NAD(P)-dependent oxidoreductase [Deltaproteobacteria bacterium]|nr:NAD(P)-dependent oxidoreductase [Deltaproteobacteria bacterium]
MKPTVGILGMGLMGRPMALNVLAAGYPLVVYNRTASRADEVVRAGARLAASPRELAVQCEVVITMVSDPPALEACLWGPDGVLAGLGRGRVLVDSSTVSPALAVRAAAACAELGASFLDAPVTGGTWGAEKGELVFMVGGEAEVLDRARPVLSTMGKRFFHLGPHGAGQSVKLAMNLILALEVGALAEALALVERAGVAGEKLVDVLQASMARAPVLDVKAPLMLERRYEPSFPLRLMHKDLGLAIQLGNELGVPLPAAAAVREVYSAVRGCGGEDLDYAGVASFWER